MEEGNWDDLIGMYKNILWNEQPPGFDLSGSESEHNHNGVPQAEKYSRLLHNFNRSGIVGLNSKVQQSQDVAPFNQVGFTGTNNLEHGIQNAGRIGSNAQNLGISTSPQDMMRYSDGDNGGIDLNKTPKRVKNRPKVVVEAKPKRLPKNYSSKSNTPGGTLRSKKVCVRKDGTKNSTPPMTDTLKVVEAFDVGLLMKSFKRKLNFDLETGAENRAEKYVHGSGFLASKSGILEKEQSVTLAYSVTTSTAGISTSPQDMRCSDGGNGGIDLNKTPLQETPKRRKHRPKVVVEAKPKRMAKHSSTKRNTHGGTPPAKKQYVRKDGTRNSTPPMTDTLEVVAASDVGPLMKSCNRKPNFDLETGAEYRAEKYLRGSGFLPSESGILEKEKSYSLANSVSTSTAGISTSPQDMRCSDGGNGGIDLNKTPLQETPERRKHRPKVVVERKSSKKFAGIKVENRNILSVDGITDGMKDLHITNSNKELV